MRPCSIDVIIGVLVKGRLSIDIQVSPFKCTGNVDFADTESSVFEHRYLGSIARLRQENFMDKFEVGRGSPRFGAESLEEALNLKGYTLQKCDTRPGIKSLDERYSSTKVIVG